MVPISCDSTNEYCQHYKLMRAPFYQFCGWMIREVVALETAARLMERDNLDDQAARLATLSAKLRALMRPAEARRMEPDLEALLEAEGLAMHPGPRPLIRPLVLEDLRQAIKACRQVELHYRNRRNRRLNKRRVHSYGFLHDHRNYLVGWHVQPKANRMALFSLPNIEKLETLADAFERNPGFSLDAFAARSFGVFQEDPFPVAWRFHPDAAKDAADFVFHPDQELDWQADGSLVVRFAAGSDLELAWHLYAWGVLEPERLAAMVHRQRVAWPALP